MIEIKKTLQLSEADYYITHLSLVNCILPKNTQMTGKEIEVLATFMALKGDITINRFGASAKKLVMSTLGLSPSGLSNYIKFLIDKGFLKMVADVLTMWPLLEPEKEQQHYRFTLTKIEV